MSHSEIDDRPFEVWFDDSKMPAAWEVEKFPPLSEEQERRLNESLDKICEKFFGKNDCDESENTTRIAV